MIFSSMSLHSNSNYFCNRLGLGFMVFTATFNNIPAISGRSILLVEETGVPGENHRHAPSHRQTLSQNVVSSTRNWLGIQYI